MKILKIPKDKIINFLNCVCRIDELVNLNISFYYNNYKYTINIGVIKPSYSLIGYVKN